MRLVPFDDTEEHVGCRPPPGRLTGLRADTTQEDVARALVEGVVCALLDGLDRLRAADVPVGGRLFVQGYAARSHAMQRALADLSERTVYLPPTTDVADTAALGCVRPGRSPALPGRPGRARRRVGPAAHARHRAGLRGRRRRDPRRLHGPARRVIEPLVLARSTDIFGCSVRRTGREVSRRRPRGPRPPHAHDACGATSGRLRAPRRACRCRARCGRARTSRVRGAPSTG